MQKNPRSKPRARKTIIFSDDFFSDHFDSDMLFAVIVRSPFAVGKITSIGFEDGILLPPGYFLFTSDDLENQKTVVTFGTRTEIFCSGEIKYKGEPVALLVGSDKKVLQTLLGKIKISLNPKELLKAEKEFRKTYTELAVNPENGEFLSRNDGNCEKSSSSNFTFEKSKVIAKRDVSCGDAESEFQNSENKIIEETWENSVAQHEIKETSGCFCFMRGGNLHILAPCKFITHLKDCVGRVTGIEKENIILTCTKQSDQNSNKIWMSGIFASMAGVAAIKTGKPVMLALSRGEEEKFIENPVKIKIHHKTAISKDGTIKAMRIAIETDAGYRNPFATEMIDRFVIAASGIYKVENLKISAKIVSSNRPTASVRLNKIDSQIFFALENQIQKACRETGFSPLEIRLQNLKNLKSIKKRLSTKNPFLMEFGRAEDALKAVCDRSDFSRKYVSYKLDENGRYETDENSPFSPPLRGIALAAAFDGNGYLGTTFKNTRFSLQVTLTEEKKLFVNTAPPSQNIKEIWQKMILDSIGGIFDLDRRSIYFNFDQAETEDDKGIVQIQNDLMIGNIGIKTHLLKNCLDTIKRKKDDALPFSVNKSISQSRKKQWNEDSFSGTPFFSTSFGCCVVEVEYDSCVYAQKVTGVYAVIDCGKIINPQAAENTAKQAIKSCLSTLVQGDKLDCAKIDVKFAQSEDEPKNLDSLIYSIVPAAFCSAVSQSIARKVTNLPLETDSIFKIKEKMSDKKTWTKGGTK